MNKRATIGLLGIFLILVASGFVTISITTGTQDIIKNNDTGKCSLENATYESELVQNISITQRNKTTLYINISFRSAGNLTVDSHTHNLTVMNIHNKTNSGDYKVPERPNYTVVFKYRMGEISNNNLGGSEKWSIVSTPKITYSTNSICSVVFTEKVEPVVTNDNTTVRYGSQMMYIGRVKTTETRKIGGKEITIVNTNHTISRVGVGESVEEQFSLLRDVEKYDFNAEKPEEVVVFVIPSSPVDGLSFGQYTRNESNIYVGAYSANGRSTIPNTYMHEYLHTKQTFETTENMLWFGEAFANYYSAELLEENSSEFNNSDVLTILTMWDYNKSSLSNPETWSSPKVPYYKGAYLLAKLDRKIQKETNCEKNLRDIVKKMNAQEKVSLEEFIIQINKTTGKKEISEWAEKKIKNRGPLSEETPNPNCSP